METVTSWDTVDTLVERVLGGLEILRGDPDFDHPVPEAELAEAILRASWTDRVTPRAKRLGHTHYLRVRSTIPTTTAGVDRNLVFAYTGFLRWHRGPGNLEGLFINRARARDLAEHLDTLAQVTIFAGGARSRAVQAWRGTGLFKGGVTA